MICKILFKRSKYRYNINIKFLKDNSKIYLNLYLLFFYSSTKFHFLFPKSHTLYYHSYCYEKNLGDFMSKTYKHILIHAIITLIVTISLLILDRYDIIYLNNTVLNHKVHYRIGISLLTNTNFLLTLVLFRAKFQYYDNNKWKGICLSGITPFIYSLLSFVLLSIAAFLKREAHILIVLINVLWAMNIISVGIYAIKLCKFANKIINEERKK